MEILSLLHADHDALREMMIELEVAPVDFESKRAHLYRVTSMAESVLKSQEGVVLDWALSVPKLKPVALGLLQKQEMAATLLRTIRMTVNEDVWDANVAVYDETLLSYIYEFERFLFPRIFDQLNDEERRELGLRYTSYRKHSQSREALNCGALAKTSSLSRRARTDFGRSVDGRVVG